MPLLFGENVHVTYSPKYFALAPQQQQQHGQSPSGVIFCHVTSALALVCIRFYMDAASHWQPLIVHSFCCA
jgi:hypothetical protein